MTASEAARGRVRGRSSRAESRLGTADAARELRPDDLPLEHTFETTATTPDGEPTPVVAQTHAGNPAPAQPLPPTAAQLAAADRGPSDALDAGAVGEHTAGQKHRPIAWVVVAIIIIGFIVAGFGLVATAWWLFGLGLGVVVVGVIVGWAGHIMADTTVDRVAS